MRSVFSRYYLALGTSQIKHGSSGQKRLSPRNSGNRARSNGMHPWPKIRLSESGFAMPMVFALGLSMMALAVTTMLLAESSRDAAVIRKDSSASLLVSDSAIAEILAELSQPHNTVLLGKDYDPNSYLGPDGIPNTADDANGGIDEWNTILTGDGYNCHGSLGYRLPNDLRTERNLSQDSQYKLLAYRYNQDSQTGSLLVEGRHNDIASTVVHMTLAIAHDSRNFPGVMADQVVHWQGRQLTGKNGNVHFNPVEGDYPHRLAGRSLDSLAKDSDSDRQQYLSNIWTGPQEGFTHDPIEGTLVACDFSFYENPDEEKSPFIPYTPIGENLHGIDGSTPMLTGDPNQKVKAYQASSLWLQGSDELIADTTNSPIHLYVNGEMGLEGSSKIRNIRTDGRPPQVGDLRIVLAADGDFGLELKDTSCIENAFVYIPEVDFRLQTSGDGCPGPSDSNVLGVVWAEDIENSVVTTTDFMPDNNPPPNITGTSGIEVPDDVSSMIEALEAINFPVFYRISGVTSWNDISLQ